MRIFAAAAVLAFAALLAPGAAADTPVCTRPAAKKNDSRRWLSEKRPVFPAVVCSSDPETAKTETTRQFKAALVRDGYSVVGEAEAIPVDNCFSVCATVQESKPRVKHSQKAAGLLPPLALPAPRISEPPQSTGRGSPPTKVIAK